jgi:phenylalanyl-tRNA synthetase beta chain
MRLCYSWLKELADFDWDPEELADRLSLSGAEGKVSGPLFPDFSGVVVGKVEESEPHPSSDTIKICKVDTGSTVFTTLCGAPNVQAGLKVAFAAPGAALPVIGSIAVVEKLGTKSEGMICSEAELGLSDDHTIIMELDKGHKIGTSLRKALELDDWLLEFDLTANRPDCLSAIGIAREIAALTNTKLGFPKFELEEIATAAADQVKVEIDDPDLCPRYLARVIKNITIGQSPWWIKKKLYSAGIRSINNVVDITNLVLMEYGHPLHAFDFDLLSAPRVLVRAAENKEKFVTLDEVERELTDEMVVITDSVKVVALGGIMGGLQSEVSNRTENVLLESAYFNPTAIRKASKELGLGSESQIRFEKGADPNIVPEACDRAAWLMQKYAGGKVLTGRVDCYPNKIKPVGIKLRPTRVDQILATELSSPQMIDILSSLGFGVKTGKELDVTVPTFRPDVTREIDLIEEIARIYGLDRIKTSMSAGGSLVTTERPEDRFNQAFKTLLTSMGWVEALTNTLIDPTKDQSISGLENHVRVLNPVSAELSVLRQNCLLSFLSIISYNLNRKKSDIGFFEIGRVFIPSENELPSEKVKLALAVCGCEETVGWDKSRAVYDFFDLKGVLQSLASEFRLGEFKIKPEKYFFFEKTASFDLYFGGELCGFCGEVAGKAREQYDVEMPVFYAEIDLSVLLSSFSRDRVFIPVPKYPSSLRDIALVLNRDVPAEDVREEIIASGGELVTKVVLFDVYEGKQIPMGKKSLAYNIEYRSNEKTLTDEEIDIAHNRIVGRVSEKFSAELRT